MPERHFFVFFSSLPPLWGFLYAAPRSPSSTSKSHQKSRLQLFVFNYGTLILIMTTPCSLDILTILWYPAQPCYPLRIEEYSAFRSHRSIRSFVLSFTANQLNRKNYNIYIYVWMFIFQSVIQLFVTFQHGDMPYSVYFVILIHLTWNKTFFSLTL